MEYSIINDHETDIETISLQRTNDSPLTFLYFFRLLCEYDKITTMDYLAIRQRVRVVYEGEA